MPRFRPWLLRIGASGAALALQLGAAFAQLPPPAPNAPGSRELAAQATAPSGLYAYRHKLAQHVKAKRHDVLQAHFEERLAALGRGETTDVAVNRMFVLVGRADEADAGFFDQWVDAYPGSFVGALARGQFHLHRAWQGRGNKFASETRDHQFAEMNRWLPLARRDAQLALQREPRCAMCLALLIRLSMPMNLHNEARDWVNQALAIDARGVVAPLAYYESLDRRWGGSRDAQSSFVRMLELAGHAPAGTRLRAELETDAIDPRRWAGAAGAGTGLEAARRALAIADTYNGRYIEAYALMSLDRHDEAVEAFGRIVEQFDSPAEVFTNRAHSYAQLKRWPEAVRDLRIAYEDFRSPWAFEMLVRLAAGNSGWALRTRDGEAGELCREAALKGLAKAMTCLGGMHFFGTQGVARDLAQARQWFARAAEAGDAQGMMDLAQMCATGQGGPADRDEAIRWWLAAAEVGHPQAQAKIDGEMSAWEKWRHVHWPEWVERSRGWFGVVLKVLSFLWGR